MAATMNTTSASERRRLFGQICDLLLQVKPHLADPAPADSLVVDLERVADAAEQLIHVLPKTNTKAVQTWQESAEELDREGVNLWNASSLLRSSAHDLKPLFTALRLAGFRLILAGLETAPTTSSLVNVLRLASKTAATLTDFDRTDTAMDVLTSAAQFEELLRHAGDIDGILAEQRASATVEFFSARMLTAWKQQNEGVAYFMLQKITESDDDRLTRLVPRERQQLVIRVSEIGRSLLHAAQTTGPTPDGKQAQESVRWLQKAFSLVESIEALPEVPELKRLILRSLARAYFATAKFDPENLSRAEATLQELMTNVDASADVHQEDYHELRWMRVVLLRCKNSSDHMILEAFRSIIEHLPWTESAVSDLLQHLRAYNNQTQLVTAVTQVCLTNALTTESGRRFVDRILLSLIFHCAKDGEHRRAVQDLEAAFASIASQDGFEFAKVPAMTCQSLLWQFGDRLFASKKFSHAADWYILAANPAFRSMAFVNNAKCFRKAALCHIQQNEYAQASALIRRCPGTDAPTFYVAFLAAAHQGLETEAGRAVADMINAPGYTRDMLLLAVQLAHEKDLKTLLASVLQTLLVDVRMQKGPDNEVEAITLIRCIIRLLMELLMQPGADVHVLAQTLVGHFDTARTIIAAASAKKSSALIAKDVAWLWRAAFNCAIQGCNEWHDCEAILADLFDAASVIMDLDCKTSILEPDANMRFQMVSASYSSITARVYHARGVDSLSAQQTAIQRRILKDIAQFRQYAAAIGSGDSEEKVTTMAHMIVVFEVEALVALREWDTLPGAIETTSALPPTTRLRTYDAIADIVWPLTDCPANVQYSALEAVLRASLDVGALDINKFSRWLRAIVSWLLVRNAAADRNKASAYIEQAVEVMRDDGEAAYPLEEKQWLLATTYNTGLQCHSASHLDESKRWFESAMRICAFVPGGEERKDRIMQTYRQLIERYSRTT